MTTWQTIFAGIAALGTVGAAVVAAAALVYFRRQANAMEASLKVTQEALKVTQESLAHEKLLADAERSRVHQQAHAAVRPEFTIGLGSTRVGPANECGVTCSVNANQPIRHVTASAHLSGREVAGECVPDHWTEFAQGVTHFDFVIRVNGTTVGDLGELRLAYIDRLGATLTYRYPFRVTDATLLSLARDLDRVPTTTDEVA